ncbi:PIF1-like helicase-domain-containing protein, partial [Mycena capillaripes]
MKFREHICDDLKHKLQTTFNIQNPTEDDIYDYGLYLIDKELLPNHSLILFGFQNLPSSDYPYDFDRWNSIEGNYLIAEQLSYDKDEQQRLANQRIAQLNIEQRAAFDAVYKSVMDKNPKLYFLHGPGGTGKSFTYNALCYALRAKAKIVLCVASSGIAALILIGGRTSHSTFKIPLNLNDGDDCKIKKQSLLAELIRKVDLII